MFKAFGTEYDGGISSMLLHFGQSSSGVKKIPDQNTDKDSTDVEEIKEQKPKSKWSLANMLLQGFK